MKINLSVFRLIGIAAVISALSLCVSAQLFSYRPLDQLVNDVGYSPVTGLLYASVPSTGGQFGNQIIVVDPRTGVIAQSVFAGSEPNKIAMTRDGNYLYVGLDGSSSVRRFALANMMSDISINLGIGSNGAYRAEDIAPMPTDPGIVAIARRNSCCSPRHEGIVVFDNGVQLPNVTPSTSQTNEIESGDDNKALYGYNNETTGFNFRQLNVDSSGVSILSSQPNVFGAFNLRIRYSLGRVYASNGKIVDANTGQPVGEFAVGGFASGIAVDKLNRRVLFIIGNSLRAFDTISFRPLGAIGLPTNVHLQQGQLTRWSRRGIAYRSEDGKLVIAESLLVTQKSSV